MSSGIEAKQGTITAPVEGGFTLLEDLPQVGVIAPNLLAQEGEKVFIPTESPLVRFAELREERADAFARENILPQAEAMGWCAVWGAKGQVQNTVDELNTQQRTITELRRPNEDHPLTYSERQRRRDMQADARQAHKASANALRAANVLATTQMVAACMGKQSFRGHQMQSALEPAVDAGGKALTHAVDMRAADRIMLTALS